MFRDGVEENGGKEAEGGGREEEVRVSGRGEKKVERQQKQESRKES